MEESVSIKCAETKSELVLCLFFGHLTYFLFIYFKLSIHLLPVVTDVYLLVTLISKYMGTYW